MPSDAELRQPLSTVGFTLADAVNGTLAEGEVQMPVNPEGGIGTLIRKVTFHLDTQPTLTFPAADSIVGVQSICALSQIQGLAGIPVLSDTRTLGACRWFGSMGSAVTDQGVIAAFLLEGTVWDYDPGILSIDQTLSVYVVSSGANLTGLSQWRGQIHYQIVRLSASEALSIASRQLSA